MEEGRPFLSAKHLMKTIDSKNRAEKDVNRKRNIRAAKREDRLKAGQQVRSGKQSLKIDAIIMREIYDERVCLLSSLTESQESEKSLR